MQDVKNKTTTVFDALDSVLRKKLVMAVYRLPGESDVSLLIQKDPELMELKNLSQIPESGGFLISPFSAEEEKSKIYLIKPEILLRNYVSESQIEQIQKIRPAFLNGFEKNNLQETDKEDFITQVRHTINQIETGSYDKVVLSRVKLIRGNYSADIVKIFSLLCESNANAFVYMFHFNGTCWMGATPEPLICAAKEQLFTVSLAGTRPYSEENTHVENWNHKERVEQEYVTQYIEKILTDYKVTHYTKKGPYTKQAGKLLHLRTDFFFNGETIGDKLPALINALHPTSAVCGIPMEQSLHLIRSLEKHDREYYSGYLGPVGLDKGMQLFVNLRCMKVLENQLVLYVGGGITSESVPEEEWEETEIKADTLLSIVQQI